MTSGNGKMFNQHRLLLILVDKMNLLHYYILVSNTHGES